ncbi:hypothetical protein [Streptosporangium carneum]|uniref:Uncharacterized protein n=1 Tax=Streptosporangium carneum TaxID=47481 RepID=A0A9W6I9U4_9ACTN|nr:hypothetical protein [Streptosporangium carneum]GLK13784.1 hypothetical protein GCM10017600_71950 [Streptosporangium carneum]
MAVPDVPDPEVTITATAHLARLTERLMRHGLHTRIRTSRRGSLQLVVLSPDAPALSEIVYAAPQEGTWWFWWSWSERIASVDETDVAAQRIGYVVSSAVRRHG